jgi:hypothetical protein
MAGRKDIVGKALKVAADYFAPNTDEYAANLNKFYGSTDPALRKRFYTGTSKDKDFTAFQESRHGTWLTDDPEDASSYALNNDSQNLRLVPGTWNYEAVNSASRVIPSYARIENPYRGDKPDWVMKQDNYKKAQSDWFDQLRFQGYDAWVPDSSNGSLAVVLKNQGTNVKSAIGNQGTFDTTKKHMGKSEGGRTGYQTKGRVVGSVVGDAVDAAMRLIAGAEPQKTVKAYKLFKQEGGKLYPLFVGANEEVPMNQWVKATAGPQAASGKVKSKIGELAYRPGWHAGDLPVATHIGAKSHGDPSLPPDTRPSNQVWGEVEMANDVDWQKVANERARMTKKGTPDPKTAHITDQVPYGGYYRYKTNPNMTGEWMIGGDMRVNRVLTDDEVKAINEAAGVSDLPRREGYGPGGAIDDIVKMAGKIFSGAEKTPSFKMPTIRPSTDNLSDVGSANFDAFEFGGDKMLPIESLNGGVNLSDPSQRRRVDALKSAISNPDTGYISRLVVDQDGNVIEGQHRLDALRESGATEAPVSILRDKTAGIDVPKLKAAITSQGGIHGDHVNQLVDMLMDADQYDPPPGFEKFWDAGLKELGSQKDRTGYGGGGFIDDMVKMAGKIVSGTDEPAKTGIRAYHGTPHDFDKFDISKIGTGEGAQAYGHGLYFAEKEGVARGYRDALSGKQYVFSPGPDEVAAKHGQNVIDMVYNSGGDPREIQDTISRLRNAVSRDLADFGVSDVSQLKSSYDGDLASHTIRMAQNADALEAAIKAGDVKLDPGHMYEVNINADPNQFLDWDKPLSEQPDLINRIVSAYGGKEALIAKANEFEELSVKTLQNRSDVSLREAWDAMHKDPQVKLGELLLQMDKPKNPFGYDAASKVTGERLHDAFARRGRQEASAKLNEMGIPGIKYLDAGSRGAGDGTRNFVVFDDKLISIIRKYGIAGASAMLGYNLMEQLDPKQALAASMADQDYQSSRPQRSMGGNNSVSGALNVARGLQGGM